MPALPAAAGRLEAGAPSGSKTFCYRERSFAILALMASLKPAALLRLRVSTSAESRVRAGHPWVFAESIREQNRPGQLGELAVIYDRQDRFLGLGLFDPESPIRMRMLHTGKPQTVDVKWWRERLRQALDRYDTTLVLKLYTAAWLPRLDEVAALFRQVLQPDQLVLRLSHNIQETAREHFGVTDGHVLGRMKSSPSAGEPPLVVFLENGLRYEANVFRGQKTGFFLDQRENRRRVERLAGGRDVLNAFSFSGAFSVGAARGGAGSVT